MKELIDSENYDLLIVDANSLIYRTHYAALQSNLTWRGLPVAATYGFFNILLKTVQMYPTKYLALCWDVSKQTFRNELFPEYKAGRAPMPEELKVQLPLLQNALHLSAFAQLGYKGYEADDLIGSLSFAAAEKGWRSLILSSDKDDLQLINSNVQVLMPKGGGIYELWDEEKLRSDFGVDGNGWLQMKALMGDKSDNIPGVSGIGVKTAAKLIAKYQTLDNLLAHLDELSGKQKQNIAESGAQLNLALKLSRIRCDLELFNEWEELLNPGIKQKELAEICQLLQFNSLISRYNLPVPAAKIAVGQLTDPDFLENKPNEAVWRRKSDSCADVKTEVEEEESYASDLDKADSRTRLLLDFLTLNYRSILTYNTGERTFIRNLLQKIQNKAANLPYYSLAMPSMQERRIMKTELETDTANEAASKGVWIYLPYLCVTEDTFCVASDVRQGILWNSSQPNIYYQLSAEALREFLLNLQHKQLSFCEREGHVFEVPGFYTFSLKELLKSLNLFEFRAAFQIDCENITEQALMTKKTEKRESDLALRKVIAGSAWADLDLQAYALGVLQTDLWAEYRCRHEQLEDETYKLGQFLQDCVYYLDLSLLQIMLTDTAVLVHRIEQPLVIVLAEMEKTGIKLDQDELQKAKDAYLLEMEKAQRQLLFAAGREINLNSPEQVSKLLFEDLAISVPTDKLNKSGFVSTKNEYLQELAPFNPAVRELLNYRKYRKLLDFAVGLEQSVQQDSRRITTEFQQMKTATGRLSSQNPNLQNIPVRSNVKISLRSAFVADENDLLLDIDYSQIELRIMAALANDEHMLQAFQQGKDVHAEVAAHIFQEDLTAVTPEQRTKAKAINFSLIYGATTFGTAKRLGISLAEAKAYLQGYFTKYAAIKEYMKKLVTTAQANDYILTAFGRRRYLGKQPAHQVVTGELSLYLTDLSKLRENPPVRQKPSAKTSAADNRIIINTPIQGTGADIIKLAMLKSVLKMQKEQLPAKLLLQVHDELLFSIAGKTADKTAEQLLKCMENITNIGVDLQAALHVGNNWADVH